MNEQILQIIERVIRARVVLRRFRRAAIAGAIIIAGSGALQAQTKPAGTGTSNTTAQNVNVVNTPSVNVANTPTVNVAAMPPVSINGAATVNVASMPAVTVAGTPNVNANVTFPANQAVTVASPGPLTHTGRLPSQMVDLIEGPPVGCPTTWAQVTPDGNSSCFDMANYPGQILVITDFFWEAEGPAGTTCVAFLRGGGFQRQLITSGATVNADGFTTRTEHLTAGVATTANPTYGGIIGGACGVFSVQLHGYVLPNQ